MCLSDEQALMKKESMVSMASDSQGILSRYHSIQYYLVCEVASLKLTAFSVPFSPEKGTD